MPPTISQEQQWFSECDKEINISIDSYPGDRENIIYRGINEKCISLVYPQTPYLLLGCNRKFGVHESGANIA